MQTHMERKGLKIEDAHLDCGYYNVLFDDGSTLQGPQWRMFQLLSPEQLWNANKIAGQHLREGR
jgi:hypothetical protein